jgi:hypothetical protein
MLPTLLAMSGALLPQPTLSTRRDAVILGFTSAASFATPALAVGWDSIGLGNPKASKANPGGAGNLAQGNWWTPSSALDTDCEGKKVAPDTRLSKECIYEKKTAEIRARQLMADDNGRYKVAKLKQIEEQAALRAERDSADRAARKAAQAKYANRR